MNISKPTAGGNKGIGLGLSLVKRIVELHDWEIKVTSAIGQGRMFMALIKNV